MLPSPDLVKLREFAATVAAELNIKVVVRNPPLASRRAIAAAIFKKSSWIIADYLHKHPEMATAIQVGEYDNGFYEMTAESMQSKHLYAQTICMSFGCGMSVPMELMVTTLVIAITDHCMAEHNG